MIFEGKTKRFWEETSVLFSSRLETDLNPSSETCMKPSSEVLIFGSFPEVQEHQGHDVSFRQVLSRDFSKVTFKVMIFQDGTLVPLVVTLHQRDIFLPTFFKKRFFKAFLNLNCMEL